MQRSLFAKFTIMNSLGIIAPSYRVSRVTCNVLRVMELLDYIRYYSCPYSMPAFTDSKPQLLLHCYRSYQFYLYLYVVSRHYHLCTLRKFRYPCHISRPKIKLGTISIEKWRVPSPFFLCQYIYLGLELRVRCYAPGLCQYLAAL